MGSTKAHEPPSHPVPALLSGHTSPRVLQPLGEGPVLWQREPRLWDRARVTALQSREEMLECLGKLKPCPQRAGTAASGGLPIVCLFGMGAARVRLALGGSFSRVPQVLDARAGFLC